MVKIINNNLLLPTEKSIKNHNSSFVSMEGPNITSELSLDDIAIPYDTHYVGKMFLSAGVVDQPLLYNDIVTGSTFLLIKVTYNKSDDPYYSYEKEYYNIEYYYADNPTIKRPLGNLMILTGSFNNKIPQIYFDNTQDYDIVIDILQANIQPIKPKNIKSGITLNNLSYYEIITDVVSCGATQFLIFSKSELVALIPFVSITSISLENNSLIIITNNNTYTFTFLSTFDLNQTYSRMLFELQDPSNRYLTDSSVYNFCVQTGGTDITSPIIIYNQTSGSTTPSNVCLSFYHSGSTGMQSGWTLNDISNNIISGITDFWDGILPISAITLKCYEKGGNEITGITSEGTYSLDLFISDNAGNTTNDSISQIYIDDLSPIIDYYYGALISSTGYTNDFTGATSAITSDIYISDGFSMSLSGSNNSINYIDIINNFIDRVYDNVDISINKYNLNVLIADSTSIINSVTSTGTYLLKFSISDFCKNENIVYHLFDVI